MPEMRVLLKPWKAPNFAVQDAPPRLRDQGMSELPSIPVADLPQETLDAMAGEWLGELYSKAGKTSPWRAE